MLSTAPLCRVSGSMSDNRGIDLSQEEGRRFQALVLGRAGLDLYPQADGDKIRDALSFSSDLGGSAGNIAVAMAVAGSRVGLISGLSEDAVGDFVRNRLRQYGVDDSLVTTVVGNERTSLAIAEVRNDDCDVVIYRNNPADLGFTITSDIEQAVSDSNNLVVTGTSLIDENSRNQVLILLRLARQNGCHTWLDLDYRTWNWTGPDETRRVYREAAALCRVLVGNEEEFAVLGDDLEQLITECGKQEQILLLKRGADGSSLFAGDSRLDSGIFPLQPLKPYGSGDAFLGNLLSDYLENQDWQQAISTGSAAAAIVVSKRGCASAMPSPEQIKTLQLEKQMIPAATWR